MIFIEYRACNLILEQFCPYEVQQYQAYRWSDGWMDGLSELS